jgi:hypothetical protein
VPGAQQAAIQALATDQGSCGSQGSARIAFHALMCVLCAVSYFRPPRLASHLTGIIHSLLWSISHSKQAWWCKSEVCQQGERPAAHAVVHAGWNQHAAGAGHMRLWYTVACSRQGVAVGRRNALAATGGPQRRAAGGCWVVGPPAVNASYAHKHRPASACPPMIQIVVELRIQQGNQPNPTTQPPITAQHWCMTHRRRRHCRQLQTGRWKLRAALPHPASPS